MRWDNSELIADSTPDELYDSAGERLLAYSATLCVEDGVNISDFIVAPATVTINSTFKASLIVTEELMEGVM